MTIDLAAITARHERADERLDYMDQQLAEAHADRAALLAEVERLRAVVDAVVALDFSDKYTLDHVQPHEVVTMRRTAGTWKAVVDALASLQEESSDADVVDDVTHYDEDTESTDV